MYLTLLEDQLIIHVSVMDTLEPEGIEEVTEMPVVEAVISANEYAEGTLGADIYVKFLLNGEELIQVTNSRDQVIGFAEQEK